MPYNKKSLTNLTQKGRGRPKGSVNKITKEDVKKLIKEKNQLLLKSKAAGLDKENLIDNLINENQIQNNLGIKSINKIKPVKIDNIPLEDEMEDKKFTWKSLLDNEIYID